MRFSKHCLEVANCRNYGALSENLFSRNWSRKTGLLTITLREGTQKDFLSVAYMRHKVESLEYPVRIVALVVFWNFH